MKRFLFLRFITTIILLISIFLFVGINWKKTLKKIIQKLKYLAKKIKGIYGNIKDSISDYISKGEKEITDDKSGTIDDIKDIINIDSNVKKTKKNNNSKNKHLIEQILHKAELYKQKGQLKEYEKKLIEGLAIDPNNIECNKLLASLYHQIDENKKSISLLKKILKENPNDYESLRQLGEIYLTKGEFDIAKKLINNAIKVANNRPKYYISMVEICYNEGNIDEAISYMHKAIGLRPGNTTYIIGLAGLYEEKDDIENAKKYYFQVLEIEPNNIEAKKKINIL